MNSMTFTNLGKKYMLDSLDVTKPQFFAPDRIVPCASEPSPLTDSIDELTVVNPDLGFPAEGWSAHGGAALFPILTDDMTVTWTLEWLVQQVDPGDLWLVLIDKNRNVLAFIDVQDVFVSTKDNIGKLDVRAISCQPFGSDY